MSLYSQPGGSISPFLLRDPQRGGVCSGQGEMAQQRKGPQSTHKGSGALATNPTPPIASLVHTSRMNQPRCPTAHPTRSPAAAVHVPLIIQLNATSARGRYGAVMVTRPNKDICVEGWRRDQRYMGTKASGADRNGRVNSGEMRRRRREDCRSSQK